MIRKNTTIIECDYCGFRKEIKGYKFFFTKLNLEEEGWIFDNFLNRGKKHFCEYRCCMLFHFGIDVEENHYGNKPVKPKPPNNLKEHYK